MTGRRVEQYEVLEQLGAGGMGVVYRARDTRLGRDVALEFLPLTHIADPQAFARFTREARAAAALNHPNICTVYDVGESDGQPFIAMELLDGVPLSLQVGAEGVSIDSVLAWGAEIAGALAAAHARASSIATSSLRCALRTGRHEGDHGDDEDAKEKAGELPAFLAGPTAFAKATVVRRSSSDGGNPARVLQPLTPALSS